MRTPLLLCVFSVLWACFDKHFLSSSSPFYSGFDVIVKTISKEGPFAVYRGFLPQWARIAPYSIIQFIMWEQMCAMAGISAV